MSAQASAGSQPERVLETFLDLVRIPSPSGQEGAVAAYISSRLEDLGLHVEEDDAAGVARAGSGNLLVEVPGTGALPAGSGVPLLLCAHMDTVAVDGPIEPVVTDGVVRTAGDTILGADDKAAVAALLTLLADLVVQPPAVDVEVLFTVCEEVGLRGAKAFDLSRCRAQAGFVLDSSGPLGEIIVGAPTQRTLTAEFHGVAAHAGIEPEAGRSAVVAAARAVAAMRLGRLDDCTTANVGVISGGAATNIVPDRCTVRAEARSRDPQALGSQIAHMMEALNVAAAEVGVDVVVDVAEEYEGFTLASDSLPARLAAAAIRQIGREPHFAATGGGSDVNVFNARGLPSVNLSAGFERIHSSNEYIPVDALVEAYRLVHELVRAAAATS